MKTLVAALGAAVLLLTPSRPSCAEIFSNFGPGLTFDQDPSHGWGINGYLGPNVGQQAISQQFTPSGGVYVFTDAQVAVGSLSTAGGVVVYLQEDAGGLPGPILEEYVVPVVTGGAPVVSVNSLVHPMLRGGRPYWLSVVAGASRFEGGWFWSLGDVCNGRDAASTQGGSPSGPWDLMFNGEPRGAFAVSGARIVQSPGPPTISPPVIDRAVLWPPDGRMVEVRVDYSFDGGQEPASCHLVVSSNERTGAWEILDEHRIRLRAQRDGGGSGRTYTIGVVCVGAGGRSDQRYVIVGVPHDARR